jgi:hypothetical protein
MKEILKGRYFDDIMSNTTANLKAIPQKKFYNCLEGLTRRWTLCMASHGKCYEGNHSDIQQRVRELYCHTTYEVFHLMGYNAM